MTNQINVSVRCCSVALALATLFLSSCDKTEVQVDIPQQELNRGQLADVSWQKSFSAKEFMNEYSQHVGGYDFSEITQMTGLDVSSLFGNMADRLLDNQDRVLQRIFNKEQGGTLLRPAKWEMMVMSYTFNSVGYQDEPIVLSAVCAFPYAVNGTSFHFLDGISVYNHARIDLDANSPSKKGDIMLLRAFYNQLVVIPDEEGSGASIEHYFAETENDRNAQQTIDAIKAALEMIGGMGIEMNEGYGTQNFGISLGGETCVGFNHYMDTKATPEEQRLINLKGTFGGAGVITPSMYFEQYDRKMLTLDLNMGLALNQLEGLLELSPSKFGGYDARTELFSPDLFEMTSMMNPSQNMMETRRNMTGVDYSMDPFQKIFQKDMLNDDNTFNYDSPKTQALFRYFKTCDLGYGWIPKTKFTLVWSDQDESMNPYMHQQAYEKLRRLPNGGTNPLMKKYMYDLSSISILPGIESSAHFILCAHYFLKCVENEYPEDLGVY